MSLRTNTSSDWNWRGVLNPTPPALISTWSIVQFAHFRGDFSPATSESISSIQSIFDTQGNKGEPAKVSSAPANKSIVGFETAVAIGIFSGRGKIMIHRFCRLIDQSILQEQSIVDAQPFPALFILGVNVRKSPVCPLGES